MDCKKVQRMMGELDAERLSQSVAHELHRHVSECSDCRVAQQRALRLQQLFTVKRHETPGAPYFDQFLAEFQHRLKLETTPRPNAWQRLCERFHIEPVLKMRYGFAHALGVAFAVALVWAGISSPDLPDETNPIAGLDFSAPHLTASSLPAPHSTPPMIDAVLPARVAAATPALDSLYIPAAAHEFTRPRYVLDHFTVTPAYEVATVHF